MSKNILVTGGAGFIGSHTALALLEENYQVIVLDNLSNSSAKSLIRLNDICGKTPLFIEGDIRDQYLLDRIFATHSINAVLHFAGLKAVSESVKNPLGYYQNNVTGTIQLCQSMAKAGVFNLVFSSSATVYSESRQMPISEGFPVGIPSNPYGRSKFMIEEFLKDLAYSDQRWRIAILRYFNPIGAHHSGLIGEDPRGIPNNLLPYISQVAIGKLNVLPVFGSDYPTHDGTAIRDYIHVVDLAYGHLKALDFIRINTGLHVWNLGTGKGYSVLDIINAFQNICNRPIPFELLSRRPGDIAEYWANPGKAYEELGWKAKRGLSDMMADTWRWQSKNPTGYRNASDTGLFID